MKSETYTYINNFVWVLMTDGTPRLAFKDEKKANEYLEKTLKTYPTSKLVKVFSGVEKESFSMVCKNCQSEFEKNSLVHDFCSEKCRLEKGVVQE
jgi:hypothetical protein